MTAIRIEPTLLNNKAAKRLPHGKTKKKKNCSAPRSRKKTNPINHANDNNHIIRKTKKESKAGHFLRVLLSPYLSEKVHKVSKSSMR